MRSPLLQLLVGVTAIACGATQQRVAPEVATAPPAFRLPAGAKPVSYRVDLTVTPASEQFRGTVEIEVELTEAARTIWLQAENLTPGTATVDGKAARTRLAPPSWLAVDLPAPAAPGRVIVKIDYEGKVNAGSGTGIFHGQLAGEWYVYTQFEPRFARQAFPCFDEPGFKVPFQLTLRVPAGVTAVSNTPVESETAGEGGGRVLRFARTRPSPSYLVAFAVGPFDVVDGGTGGSKKTPLRYFVPRGQAARIEFVKAQLPRIVGYLEDYTAIPFPWDKLDLVAAVSPTWFHGAMENTGMIVSGMDYILSDDKNALSFRQGALSLVAHETAHMWFGDLVTMAWWDDIWLNESFASWLAEKTVAALEPAWHREADALGSRSWAISADLEPKAQAMHRVIENDFHIVDAFDGISYAKGQAVLRMLEGWLGADVFRAGVRAHLAAHPDGSATATDFFGSISQAAGRELTPVLRSFLEQPGLPLVRGEVTCSGKEGRLHLEQERFQAPGAPASAAIWATPICVRYGRGADAGRRDCFILEQKTQDQPLAACPDWIVLNADHGAYFVSSASPDSIGKTLGQREHLSRMESLGVLADLLALVRAGAFPAADAMRLTEPLLPGADADVRKAIVDLDEMALIYAADADRPAMLKLVTARHGAALKSLGLSERPGDDPATTDLRLDLGYVIGLYLDDPELDKTALAMARRWLADRNSLDLNSRYWVPFVAAGPGGAALLAEIRKAAKGAASEDVNLMAGLVPFFTDPALVREGFAWALSDEVPAGTAMYAFYAPRETRGLMLQLAEEHVDQLIARTPPDMQVDLIIALASGLCSAGERAAFVRLFGERAARLKDGAGQYEQKLASIDKCIAVRKVQEPGISAWLKTRTRWLDGEGAASRK